MILTPRVFVALLGVSAAATEAHVPYFETSDLSGAAPFLVEDITQSKAIYAYLDDEDDADAYFMIVREPTRIYAKTIIPYCSQYSEFRPSFALVGPGLPTDDQLKAPVKLEPEQGIIVREDIPTGAERDSMYEVFSDQFYYEGPILDITVKESGNYWLWFWNPAGETGDYVAIIGKREVFSVEDIRRSFYNTPEIRRRGYLNVECEEPSGR